MLKTLDYELVETDDPSDRIFNLTFDEAQSLSHALREVEEDLTRDEWQWFRHIRYCMDLTVQMGGSMVGIYVNHTQLEGFTRRLEMAGYTL